MDVPGPSETAITPERRALLARKGEILYAKYCGTKGRGICAENFAMFQLKQGNEEVVRDFLRFLEGRLASLSLADPDGLGPMTAALIGRLRGHLGG